MRRHVKSWLKEILANTHVPAELRSPPALFTFDDGPHPEVTPRILDLLEEYELRGVFFIVGNRIQRAPSLLREIISRGHILGNHSYMHDVNLGLAAYCSDVRRAQAAISNAAGVAPGWFRPPRGTLSAASVLAPRMLGLRTMLWSIDSGDWRMPEPGQVTQCAEGILGRLSGRTSGTEIVLMHDDKPHTPRVLELVLQETSSRRMPWASGI